METRACTKVNVAIEEVNPTTLDILIKDEGQDSTTNVCQGYQRDDIFKLSERAEA